MADFHSVMCEWWIQRDDKEVLRVLSELRTVIAVRAKDTEEREHCALLRQNPDYRFEEMESSESAMSRTINNIGFASEEWHMPVVNAESPADACVASESETVLQSSNELTDETRGRHTNNSLTCNSDSLPNVGDAGCLYTKHMALMAVAKSQQMVRMSEDTFEDDDCTADSDG